MSGVGNSRKGKENKKQPPAPKNVKNKVRRSVGRGKTLRLPANSDSETNFEDGFQSVSECDTPTGENNPPPAKKATSRALQDNAYFETQAFVESSGSSQSDVPMDSVSQSTDSSSCNLNMLAAASLLVHQSSSQDEALTSSSQSGIPQPRVNIAAPHETSKKGNLRGKRGTLYFEATFVKPNFVLPKPYSEYWLYVGHNKEIEAKLDKEKRKKRNSRPSTVRGGILFKCTRCSMEKRAVDGQLYRLDPHMETHGFIVENSSRKKTECRNRKVVHVRKYARNDPPQTQFNKNMIRFLVQSGIPFNAIHCPAFSKMINDLEFRVNVLTPKSYFNHLKRIVGTEVVPYVYSLLKSAEYIGLVIDAWTNRKNEAVFCVQAVFMDQDYNLVQKTIAAIYMNQKHTGDYVRKLIMDAIRKYDIAKKVTYIISDKGSNMIKAIDLVGSLDYRQFHRDYEFAYCYAHCVHNIMLKSLEESTGVMDLINEVVNQIMFISRGQDTARDLKRLANRRFVRPVRTRWSSYYKMLKRFLEDTIKETTLWILKDRQEAFSKGEYSREVPAPFTEDQYGILSELLSFMGPVAAANDLLQADTYKATAAIVTIIQCHKSILAIEPVSAEANDFRRNLSKNFKQDFADSLNSKGLVMMTALNPAWRPQFFKVYHKYFVNDPYSLPDKEAATRLVKNVLAECAFNTTARVEASPEIDFCDDLMNQLTDDEDDEEFESTEIERFMSSKFKHYLDKQNPNFVRDFWVSKQTEFPKLFKLFCKHFIRRVSTASVERSFSKLTKLCDKYRPFKISTLGDLLMLSENISVLGETEEELLKFHEIAERLPVGMTYASCSDVAMVSDSLDLHLDEEQLCTVEDDNQIDHLICITEETIPSPSRISPEISHSRLLEIGDFDGPEYLTGSDAIGEILEITNRFR